MSPEDLISEMELKYGEYLEMAENPSAIMCKILAALLLKEMEYSKFYKDQTKLYQRINNVNV